MNVLEIVLLFYFVGCCSESHGFLFPVFLIAYLVDHTLQDKFWERFHGIRLILSLLVYQCFNFSFICLVAQLCLTFCDPMDCNLPGSSVHGDSAGKNTGVGCHDPLSRGSWQPRDWTQVFWTAGGCFTIWATRGALFFHTWVVKLFGQRFLSGKSFSFTTESIA